MHWDYGWQMGGMWLFWLLGLLLLAALVWVIVRTASNAQGSSRAASREDDSPETILKRRYARGEIDRDEYERRLEDLRR
jgi:putative membrane protein